MNHEHKFQFKYAIVDFQDTDKIDLVYPCMCGEQHVIRIDAMDIFKKEKQNENKQ